MTEEQQPDIITDVPLTFKDKWHAEKLLKKTKKKARNNAMKEHGMTKSEATKAVKKAIGNLVGMNKPMKRTAGRGR
jgi:hypothetical protein